MVVICVEFVCLVIPYYCCASHIYSALVEEFSKAASAWTKLEYFLLICYLGLEFLRPSGTLELLLIVKQYV